MAEVRNNFLKSRMNKDLDARLVPSGEYRDATNVSISKSEGDDVGALETVLGNVSLTDFGYTTDCNVDIIGKYMDIDNDRIIVFMTNYVDTSSDRLSNFAPATATCSIGVYSLRTSPASSTIVVSGRFLNFSKTHEVYGVNVINDLLFWTDNRNQPRKINLTRALSNPSYYTTEDTISVAKYYPYETIKLWKAEITTTGLSIAGTNYTTATGVTTTNIGGTTGTGLTFNITASAVAPFEVTSITISNPGVGYKDGDQVLLAQFGSDGNATVTLRVENHSTMEDVTSPDLPTGNDPGTDPNPLYDANWKGDPDYLKERFVRFSYRFEFDDGEFSLIAPFTQECFIPEQDGYFLRELNGKNVENEKSTYKGTEVSFVRNKVSNIKLMIPAPKVSSGGGWSQAQDELKVSKIEILYKQSDENVIKIVDTIEASEFNVESNNLYQYDYQSSRPWKTLPSRDILRVFDQVPVRALCQEVADNRVIYANYVDKPVAPTHLDYSAGSGVKNVEDVLIPQPNGDPFMARKEYQNHTLKQKRTYQVGVVLSDRYGRQSTVVLSEYDSNPNAAGSTLFHEFKSSPFSTDGSLISNTDTWPGDALKLTFYSGISSVRSSITGEPGLYNVDTNPLGWYSYKVVVKQTEQDYYNVYLPGTLSGYIDGESAQPTIGSVDEPIAHTALFADNINKIPRDLSLVGPNQNVFRSGRPSPKDDPSYYEFVNKEGETFTADPYDPDFEALLKARDRERDLDSGSQITNASVRLSPRVVNFTAFTATPLDYTPTGYTPAPGVAKSRLAGGGSGNGMRVDATIDAAGSVTDVVIVNPGTGYRIGDVLDVFKPGPAAKATFTLAGTLNTTKQSYPGIATDSVTTIGTGVELGLWDPSAASPYNTAPVFYSYENNPYIAKIEVSDYLSTAKDSGGVAGPSQNAGKLNYNISTMANNGTDYVAGSKNVNTKPVAGSTLPVTASNIGEKGSGVILNIDSVSTGGTPGSIGTLNGAGGSSLSIANDDGKGIKGFESLAYPYSVDLTVLAGQSDAEARLNITKTEFPGYMSPILSVYETEPIESKLDIYWESSTSGLISQLNTKIGNSDLFSPYGFADSLGAKLNFNLNEGDNLATNVFGTGTTVFIQNYAGASVVDGNGNSRTGEFTLTNNFGDDFFTITTNSYFMYGNNGNTRENYTFFINYQVPSPTFAIDGTRLIGTMQLGFWTGTAFNPTICQLSNLSPSFDLLPWGGGPAVLTVTASTGVVSPNGLFKAVNGSNVLGGLKRKQLSFSLLDASLQPYVGSLDLQTISGLSFGIGEGVAKLIMKPDPTLAGTSESVYIQVQDGGGITSTIPFTVNFV
jgi:hypothetical protein